MNSQSQSKPTSASTTSRDPNAAFQRAMELHEQRARRAETLFHASAAMSSCGISKHTINTALRGLHLFLETTGQTSLALNPSPQMHEAFTLLSTIEPATTPGLLLSDVPTLPTEWLWPQRIPLGALTLLEGCPGTGTSLLALSLAAIVSSGQSFPDGPTCPQGRVIIVAPHDSASTAIKPRLLAAGGDPAQVLWLSTIESLDPHSAQITDRPFSLALDLDRLEQAIVHYEPLLIIIDTLDSLSPRQRSTVLPLLNAFAQTFGCAIVLLHAARPSASFISGLLTAGGAHPDLLHLIRSALRIVPASSDEDAQQFLLICTKQSLEARPVDLAFEISSDLLSPESASLPASRASAPEHPTFTPIAGGPPLAPASSISDPTFSAGISVPILLWQIDPAASSASLHRSVPLSRLRQILLHTLAASPQPLSPRALATLTGEGYAAVRQTLRRMRESGELLSPARGLYTTPDHPSPTITQPANPPIQPSQVSQPSQPSQIPPSPQIMSSSPSPQTSPSSQIIPSSPLPQIPSSLSIPSSSPPPQAPSSPSIPPSSSPPDPPPTPPNPAQPSNPNPSPNPDPSSEDDDTESRFPSAIIRPRPPYDPFSSPY